MLGIPLITPRLSTLWVSMVSKSPRALVGPLVASLRHDMVVRDNPVHRAIAPDALPFDEALQASLDDDRQLLPSPRTPLRHSDDETIREARLVRSVQRFPLPVGKTAEWAGQEYLRWLDGFGGPFIHVDVDSEKGTAKFSVPFFRRPVLELAHAPDRSHPDRALFYVTGGLLADTTSGYRGRLEFRQVLGGTTLLAAIHDFAPSLPWRLYRLTQAIAHLVVMHQFGRHLETLQR